MRPVGFHACSGPINRRAAEAGDPRRQVPRGKGEVRGDEVR